jgi:hypothetical protein
MGFKPGESGNVGGKPHHMDALLSRSLRIALADRAPDEVCKALGLPAHASWAQCLARKLIVMAIRGDFAAMREIREATEGTRLHADLAILDPNETPPVITVIFQDSDGNGRVLGTPVEALLPHVLPSPPALPGGTENANTSLL